MAHNATYDAAEPLQGTVEGAPSESTRYFEHNVSRFQYVQ